MANFLNVGDYIKVTAFAQLGSQVSQNIRIFRCILLTNLNTVTDGDVAEDMNTVLKPLYVDWMSQNASYLGITAQILSPIRRPAVGFADSAAGGNAAEPLPPAVAGLVSYQTSRAGRANRGRMYAPFPPETYNGVDGRPTAGALVSLLALGEAWATNRAITAGADSATIEPVIFPSTELGGLIITETRVRGRWATMRSRSDFSATNVTPF